MKTVGLVAMLVAVAGFAFAGGGEYAEKGWDCNVCKAHMEAGHPPPHMKFDMITLEQGGIIVTTTDESHAAEIHRLCESSEAALREEMAKPASERKLCPLCTSYANLMKLGVSMEHLQSRFGEVALLTGTDEAQVKAIHDHIALMKKMMGGKQGTVESGG